MSSKAITERRDGAALTRRWQAPREMAPSLVKADEPWISRVVGAIGLALIVLGGVSLIASHHGRAVIIAPWLGNLFVVLGLGGLLLHAANDADPQIRRSYMYLGLAWVVLALVVSFWPWPALQGQYFLSQPRPYVPSGLQAGILGVLFLMCFVRNETDEHQRLVATNVIGVLGSLMALGGLFFGSISTKFLLPDGFVLGLFGLLFVWAYVGLRGSADDMGYKAGLGLGAAGALTFVVAFVRSFVLPWMAKVGWIQPPMAYTMPNGLALMGLALFYMAVSAGICLDKPIVVMTRRELASLFFSPIAYITLLGLTLIAWFLFLQFVSQFLSHLDPARGEVSTPSVKEPIIARYILHWFPIICLIFLVPTVTMRLISEEKRTGTIEMTLTAPVNETTMVLSKFAAGLFFFMLAWLPWALFLVGLWSIGGQPFDFLPLLGFYIVLAATGAGFVGMGLFFSSLTRNQITAAILTFVGMVGLTLIFFVREWLPISEGMKAVLTHISYVDLWINVIEGKLGARELLYHVSAAVFWLFLTVKVLESRKWR